MLTFAEVDRLTLPDDLDERAYHALWCGQVAQSSDPLASAFNGGIYADRLAWVFVAGYQAAIRAVFAEQRFVDWAAFCVTEDRSGRLAPVTYANNADGVVLTGAKTWVAASDHVQDLVIKAGRGADAIYLRVPRSSAGVELITRPPGATLPDLSQGQVHFHGAQIPAAALLDQSRVGVFGSLEGFYVLVAWLGWTCRTFKDLRVQITPLLQTARTLGASDIDRSGVDFQAFVQGVARLLEHVGGRMDDPAWHRDQPLIQRYARQR